MGNPFATDGSAPGFGSQFLSGLGSGIANNPLVGGGGGKGKGGSNLGNLFSNVMSQQKGLNLPLDKQVATKPTKASIGSTPIPPGSVKPDDDLSL